MAIASTFNFTNYVSITRPDVISSGGKPYFWFNTGFATSSNNQYTTLNLDGFGSSPNSGPTPYLAGYGITNPNGLIPTDASIEGLILRIERAPNINFPSGGYSGTLNIYDSYLRFFNSGAMIGNDKATGTLWSTSESYINYGGENDNWGASLTPAILNSNGFGVSIGATTSISIFGSYNGLTGIDHVELTVFYTTAGGTQIINPPPIISQEFTSQHKLIRIISPRGISDRETTGRHKLIRNLYPNSIQSNERTTGGSLARVIKPGAISSQERLSNSNRLTTSATINPRVLKSEELITRNIKFFNRFYDTLDIVNVWNEQSDPGDFTWDDSYRWNLTPNSKSIRRIGSPSRLNKFSTSSYKFIFYNSNTIYYSGYVYLANSPNYGGLGFHIQDDLNSGYYAVIDTRNGSGGTSTHSFRLFRVTRSGGSNTFTNLATYNLTGLISQAEWYRIIIEVSSSGNITAKLYKDRGSTLISAATLTATDTNFTEGYLGLTAFSEAGFDNLTNITAQFSEVLNGVSSPEVLQRPQLNPGVATISLQNRSIQSQEKISRSGLLQFIIQNPTYKEISNSTPRLNPGTALIEHKSIKSEEKIIDKSHALLYVDLIYDVKLAFYGHIPNHQLNPGVVLIEQKPLFKSTTFNQPALLPIISANSIFDDNSLTINKLIANINPRTLFRNPIINQSSMISNINPRILKSEELILQNKIVQNINTKIFAKLNSFDSGIKLNALNTINPNILFKSSSISLHEFTLPAYFMYPKNIKSEEILSINKIISIIKPSIVNLQDSIGQHSLVYSIQPYNIFKFNNNFGTHILTTGNTLQPRVLSKSDQISIHKLDINIQDIQPIIFDSLEKLGRHSFVRIIKPNAIIDFESQILKLDKLKSNFNLYPSAVNILSSFGIHELLPLTATIAPNLFNSTHLMGQFLTVKSGEIVIYQNTLYPLLDNYQPPMTEGPIGTPATISINNILPESIESLEQISSPNLYAFNFIYQYQIYDYDELLPKIRLVIPGSFPTSIKPDPEPGQITSWIYLPHIIESHLNYRKTS